MSVWVNEASTRPAPSFAWASEAKTFAWEAGAGAGAGAESAVEEEEAVAALRREACAE